MSCFYIDQKVSLLRARRKKAVDVSPRWGEELELRGACRRKHLAAVKRERLVIVILTKAERPLTLDELAHATRETLSALYSTVLRLRARGAIVSAQREHSRAHAHALKKDAA